MMQAKRVPGFPPGTKCARYPDEWFDGSIWELIPGEDTRSQDPKNAQRVLLAAGRTRDLWMKTQIHDGKVYIQATGTRTHDQ